MAIKSMRILALFLAITLLLVPSAALPCGPVFPTAIFSLTGGPDAPLQNFYRGDLGVLQPGFRSFHLVPAYRYLAGIGLNPEEQQALLGETGVPAESHVPRKARHREDDWVQNWLDARGRIKAAGATPNIGWHSGGSSSIYRTEQKDGNYYAHYLNCGEDAFKTATATLGERTRMFGEQAPEILDWVKAQDTVFSNCSQGKNIPDPAVPGSNPVLRADRAYQIAAANFYSGDFDQAEKIFLEISQDKTSTWRTIVPYLAARCQVRNATIKGGFQKVEMTSMARAEASLRAILQDSSLSQYHKSAEDLLGYVETRLHPAEQLHKVAQKLVKQGAGPELRQNLQDFRYLLMSTGLEAQKAAREQDDLIDWVLTFQNQTPDPLGHAIERFEKTRSPAWLIAAISRMPAGHPKQQLIQAEADKLLPASAGYQTAVYHSMRLLVDSGKQDVAKKRLDSLLGNTGLRLSHSARNLLLGLRMRLCNSLDEFLQYGQRTPAAVGYGYDEDVFMDEKVTQEYAGQKMLDDDSVRIVNGYLPQNMLVEIASKPVLPQKIRKDIALAAWVRAVLLENEQAVRNTSAVLSQIAPEMQAQLAGYAAAATPQERKFAASSIILKNPGMKPFIFEGIGRATPLDKIDNFRNNWWCELGSERNPLRRKADHEGKKRGKRVDYPGFMTKEQMQRTEQEMEALQKAETAPNYLTGIILPWAEAHQDDPRVPEALYLLVKATRYGCGDDETSGYSKAAFKLLHKRYPKSTWAKETPYHF